MIAVETLLSFLPPELRQRRMRPFLIPLPTVTLAPGQSQDMSTGLQNVAAYLLTSIVGRVNVNGAPDTASSDPPLTANLQVSSGDDITDGPMPWGAVVGSLGTPLAEVAGWMIAPRLISGGSTVTLSVANLSAAVTLDVRVGLAGINVYSN